MAESNLPSHFVDRLDQFTGTYQPTNTQITSSARRPTVQFADQPNRPTNRQQQTKRESRPTWKARIGKPLNTSIKKQCCADSGKISEKVSGGAKPTPDSLSGALRSITLRPISLCEAQLQASEQKVPYSAIRREPVNRMQIAPRQRERYLRPNPTSEHCENKQNAPYIYEKSRRTALHTTTYDFQGIVGRDL